MNKPAANAVKTSNWSKSLVAIPSSMAREIAAGAAPVAALAAMRLRMPQNVYVLYGN